MVGHVREASTAVVCACATCTRATRVSVGSRAQLVRLWAQIKTTTRSRMGHTVSDKRVYCHKALHLKEKLTKAGYKEKVEKWDSGSDSDSSDEEDLPV